MDLTFLSAGVPLTKTIAYSDRDDAYATTSYPLVSRMTSHRVGAASLSEFCRAIREQGSMGRCLLKGGLQRELVDESRAGLSVEEDHTWVCFDFDGVDCPPTIEGALTAIGRYLPPYVQDVDAVIQLSAKCMHPETTKLHAHVFMALDAPIDSATLNAWLTSLNFQTHVMPELRLTDSGNALSFPIDRTMSSPARIIYIAPPKTVGFTPGHKEMLRFVAGRKRAFTIAPFTPTPNDVMYAHINKLRVDMSLPEREFKTVKVRGQEVLTNPGECVLHDIKPSGGNYLRFNINGGDSLGYFINLKDPHLIGNFKGEPYMYTREVNEAFYKALTKAVQAMPNTTRTGEMEVLAFYATNRGSSLYIGTYDRAKDILRVDVSNETAASSWLKQFGMPIKPALPHYDLTFDVRSDIRYEEGYPVINLYERTNFIKEYADRERIRPLDKKLLLSLEQKCPVIYKTLRSVTGDERSFLVFLNWLSYIFQTREKTGTAWLFWGRQGTGKGMLMQHIIAPLFGRSTTGQVLMTNIDSNFNSLLEGKLIVNIDEAAMTRSRDKIEVMSKLKNYITEPTVVINEKRQVEREVESFINLIFTSNDSRPIIIDDSDRRFHIATRQEQRLQYTPNEMAILAQGEELPAFAETLGDLIIDEFLVRNTEQTDAKARLFEATHNLVDRVAMAIMEGDSNFFFEARPSDLQLGMAHSLLPISEYDDLLRAMAAGTLNVLRREDLYVLFKVVVQDDKQFPENPSQQRQIFQRHQLLPSKTMRCKRQRKAVYGAPGPEWKEVREELKGVIRMDAPGEDKVIPIERKKK